MIVITSRGKKQKTKPKGEVVFEAVVIQNADKAIWITKPEPKK